MPAVEYRLLILVLGGFMAGGIGAASRSPHYMAWSGLLVLLYLGVKTGESFLTTIFILVMILVGLGLAGYVTSMVVADHG